MMSPVLRIALLVFAIIVIVSTTLVLKKGRIPIKYSLIWYFSALIIFIVAVLPFILEVIANTIGFKTTSNLVIGIIISLLLFITMSLTIITSGQKKKITLLIQEISIMNQKITEIEKRK